MPRSDLFATYSLEPAMVILFKPERILDSAFVARIGESLKDLAARAHEEAFVLDLSRVGYLSSAALGMLLGLARAVAERGGRLKLAGLSPENRELFRITRLDGVFDICEDVRTAVEALRREKR